MLSPCFQHRRIPFSDSWAIPRSSTVRVDKNLITVYLNCTKIIKIKMTREWRTEWLNKWLRTDNSKHCPSTVQAFDTSVTSSTHVLASKHWVRHARPFFPPDFEAAATRHDMARYGTIWHDKKREIPTLCCSMLKTRDKIYKMLPEYAICSLSATCDLCYPLFVWINVQLCHVMS